MQSHGVYAGFGVPMRRRRVFIVASMHGDARDVLLSQGMQSCPGSCKQLFEDNECYECRLEMLKQRNSNENVSFAIDLGCAMYVFIIVAASYAHSIYHKFSTLYNADVDPVKISYLHLRLLMIVSCCSWRMGELACCVWKMQRDCKVSQKVGQSRVSL